MTLGPSCVEECVKRDRAFRVEGQCARQGGQVDAWKSTPLGVAVVDRTSDGTLAIHHVAVGDDGILLSGIWNLSDPSEGEVADRLAHWIVTGTRDGLEYTQDVLGADLPVVDLAGLVDACESAEESLQESWEKYRDAEPRKRANLKPLAARSWPTVAEDGDAAVTLSAAGVSPYPESTPVVMRDVLAFARLVQHVLLSWWELETERTSRAYLGGGERQPFPPDWLASHPPYWPGRGS